LQAHRIIWSARQHRGIAPHAVNGTIEIALLPFGSNSREIIAGQHRAAAIADVHSLIRFEMLRAPAAD